MSPSELAHLFIDGEAIDPVSEATLFDALAANGELRAELRELLAVRAAVQWDVVAFTPPAETTRRLFTGLGVVPSGGSAALAASQSGWLRRLWLPIVTALVGSAITGVVITQMNPTSPATQRGGVARVEDSRPAQQAPSTPSTSTPIVSSSPRSSARPMTSQFPSSVPRASHPYKRAHQQPVSVSTTELPQSHNVGQSAITETPRSPVMPTQNATMQSPPPSSTIANQERSTPTTAPRPPTSQPAVETSKPAPPSEPAPAASPKEETVAAARPSESVVSRRVEPSATISTRDPLYMIGVRAIVSSSSPSTSVATNAGILPTNLGIGAFRLLSEHHQLGIELGQEPFGQQFWRSEGDSTVTYRQNPMLFWGAVAYRAISSPLAFLAGIQPYGQIDAGATRGGPLARVVLGLMYDFDQRVDLMFGAESAMLWYQFQSGWYSTRKLGVTFGAGIRF